MRKQTAAVGGSLLGLAALTAWSHFATAGIGSRSQPDNLTGEAVDPVPVTAGGNPGLNYSTGFEPDEGFVPGYISNSGGSPAGCGGPAFPCWGHTTGAGFSLITPTIENLHPATGLQHLRLTHDPSTRTNIPNFGLGVDARYPRTADLSARPVAPNTVSLDIAISGPEGQDFRIQPQSNSQGLPATSVLFFYTGEIYILFCETGAVSSGHQWDTTGAYQNFTVAMYPCSSYQSRGGYGGNGVVNYYYAGNLIYFDDCLAGSNLEQFLVFGDNYPGSSIDVDHLVMSSLDECPHTCGNDIIEQAFEECEVTPSGDAVCPGRCIAVGQPGECTCTPICTFENPCPVQNGENGPFISSSGFYVYSGNSPFISVDGCGTYFDARLWLGVTDEPGNALVFNSNCQQTGSSGTNSDSSAPCYTASGFQEDPCACVANPGGSVVIQLSGDNGFVPLGSLSYVNIRKKAACAGDSVGACCDTNGADTGCTDNVTSANCSGADKVWTDQGKCASTHCECIPDCAGATCAADGCGGSCGTCGDNNACNGVETCQNRNCVAGTPLSCNDGNACNGAETCNPSSGCVSGTSVNCDDGQECSVDTCNEPDGTCSHDDSGCSIPTVSEWGLVVLTVLLLVAAKVQFGRVRRDL